MDRKVLLAFAFTAVFVVGALLVFLNQPSADPLAQFRAPDGRLTIPGGAMTKELQQLLFPPRPPESYYTYQPARSPYPTLLIEGVEHRASEFTGPVVKAEGPSGFVRPIAWLVGQLRPFLVDAFRFFMDSAVAADGTCGSATTDNCYWILGTGNFSDVLSHWSSTTGPVGTPCLCSPASTNALVFDVNSGAGTVTQDNASFTSGSWTITSSVSLTNIATGTTTVVVGGAFDEESTAFYVTSTGGTWSVSGAWTNKSTSASWSFAAAITFKAAANQTMTFCGSSCGGGTEFSGNTTFDKTGSTDVTYTMSTKSLVISTSKTLTVTRTAGSGTVILNTSGGNLAVTTGPLTIEANGLVTANGSTITLSGNFTNNNTAGSFSEGTSTLVFAASGTMGGAAANNWQFFNITANSGVTLTTAKVAQFKGTFTALGTAVVNSSVTSSGRFSWNAATQTGVTPFALDAGVTFTGGGIIAFSPTGNNTANVTGHDYGNWLFQFRGLGTNTYTMTGNVSTTNVLQLGIDVPGNSTLDTSGSNYSLTVGGLSAQSSLLIGAAGGGTGQLNLHGSTLTISNTASTVAGLNLIGGSGANTASIIMTSATVSITNSTAAPAVLVNGSSNAYMQLGSSTWTVVQTGSGAPWNNLSQSTSWLPGTSSVTLKATSAAGGTTFCGTPASGAAATACGSATNPEFYNLVLDQSSGTGTTYTMLVQGVRTSNSLTVQRTAGTGSVTLSTSGSNFAVISGSVTLAANGALTANGSTITVNGSWNSSAGTFTKGTSTVVLAATGTLVTGDSNHFNRLTINLGTTTTTTGTVSVDDIFTLNGTVTDSGNSITKYIVLSDSNASTDPFVRGASGTFTTSGNLGLQIANSNTATTLINVPGFTSVNLPVRLENNAAVAGSGTEYRLAANISAFTLTLVSNGNKYFFNSQTFNVTLGGPFNHNTVLHAIVGVQSTSGTWDIGGFGDDITFWWSMGSISATVRNQSWGGNEESSQNGNNWNAGTSTFTFLASQASPGDFCPAGGDSFHLTQPEFYNIVFDSSTTSTWNMAGSADCSGNLLYANSMTVRNTAAGTTTLTTSNHSITGKDFTVAAGGTLSASASSLSLTGNWDSSAATATLTAGTSTATLSGTSKTVALRNSSNGFYNLTTSGTITASTTVWASNTLLVSGTLTKTGQSIVFKTLTATSGTISDGAVSATGFSVSNSGANLTTISVFTTWTTGSTGTYKWTDTIAAGTDTFTITVAAGNTAFTVLKDGSAFASGSVVAQTVTFTMTSGDPVVEVDAVSSVPCTTYYWVNGTGNWSDNIGHWASASGGATPCDAYPNTSSSNVVFDSSSGSGTATVDVNPTTGSVTIGGSVAVSAGAHTITVNGNWDSSAGTFMFGTSTVITSATGTLKTASGATRGTNRLYNLTIGIGVTTTILTNATGIANVLTVNGTLAGVVGVFVSSSNANPLVIGASGSFGQNDQSVVLYSFVNYNVPAIGGANGPNLGLESSAAGITATMQGNITSAAELTVNPASTDVGTLIFDTNGFNLTTTSTSGSTFKIGVSGSGTVGGAILFRTGTHEIRGDIIVQNAISYLDLGSATITTRAGWTNNSTSASWNAGTSNVSIVGATSGFTSRNITPGALPVNEFYNLTFAATNQASAQTYTLVTNSLKVANTLTVSDTNSTTTLTKTGRSVTFKSLSVASGGILTDGAVSATGWTVTGGSGDTMTLASGAMTLWSANAEWKWTHSATGASSMTISITVTVANGTGFDVKKDSAAFTNGAVAGGAVTFTMMPSDPAMDVSLVTACGPTCYWVGGTGVFSSTIHWSDASGSGFCSCTPIGTDAVVWDANSGGGVATQDLAPFASGSVTIAGPTSVNGSANTWVVNGNWNSGASTFVAATSTVNLSGASKTLAAADAFYFLVVSGAYTLSSASAAFVDLHVTGSFTVTGQVVTAVEFSTDSGTISLTAWAAYDSATPDIEWTFDPSAAGATVTMAFGSMTPDERVTLFRDGTNPGNALASMTVDPSGNATFVVAAGWSSHSMFLLPTASGGGAGGTPPPNLVGSLSCQPLGGLTYQCTVTPATGETVNQVRWDWGDGRTTTTATNSSLHTYAAPGSYLVTANVSYASGKAETLTSQLAVAPGPSILEYLIVIVFLVSAIGAVVSRRHAKMFWAVLVLVLAAWMLYLFPVSAFPVFFPRVLLQGVVLLGGIAGMVYGFFPDDRAEGERGPSHKHRAFWLIWGSLMIILFFLTR